jgi:hypothetical protein
MASNSHLPSASKASWVVMMAVPGMVLSEEPNRLAVERPSLLARMRAVVGQYRLHEPLLDLHADLFLARPIRIRIRRVEPRRFGSAPVKGRFA